MPPLLAPLLNPVAEYWRRRTAFGIVCLALGFVVPIAFVLYANEVWEDFFITYRYSENLANGHGLVYSPGEHVHGFTSPLNTLLPAFFAWATQAKSYVLPLLLYRVVSLAGLAVALVSIASVISRDDPPSRLRQAIGALFPLIAVLEIKTTAFATNGQEAGLMLGFLVPAFVLAYVGWNRSAAWLGGVCLAGLMYTRPDGFVYGLAVLVGGVAFGATPRREFLAAFARSAAIAFALYAPWLVFAQSYFGSVVPHTITAKNGSQFYSSETFGLFAPVAAGLATLPQRLTGTLAAIYDFQITPTPVTWPKWSHDVMFGLEGAAVTYWLVPTRDRLGRMASLCSVLILAYLTYASLIAPSCPWYYPPLAFLSLLTLLRMSMTLPGYVRVKSADVLAVPLAALLVLFLGFVFVNSARALKIRQEVIEWGNRRPLGLWLREAVRDHETVYLEPLGYIGYFSQRKMLDWPGLVAPEVVAARRKIGRIPNYPWGPYLWAKAAEELKPDWIVARADDVNQMRASEFLTREYRLVKVFDVSAQVAAAGTFYGCSLNYYDSMFQVFRRREAEKPASERRG